MDEGDEEGGREGGRKVHEVDEGEGLREARWMSGREAGRQDG